MIKYDIFYREFITRRQSDLVRILLLENLKELPICSVLHTASGLYDGYGKTANIIPDMNLYSNFIDDKKLNILFVKTFPTEKDLIRPPQDGIRQVISNLEGDIKKIRTLNPTRYFLINSYDNFNSSNVYTNMVCHDPLFKSTTNGIRIHQKMFDLILASMLNSANKTPSEFQNFFIFKTENIKFALSDFVRTFKEYSRATIKYYDSTYYLIVMHMLGYLHNEKTDSMFNKLSPEVMSRINIVFKNKERFVIYRLDVLREILSKSPNLILSVINNLNTLSTTLEEEEIGPKEIVSPDVIEIPSDNIEVTNTTKFIKTPTVKEEEDTSTASVKKLDEDVVRSIVVDTKITEDKKKYVKDLAVKYKDIRLEDNKTIQSIIEKGVDKTLSKNTVPEIENISVPDISLVDSSIANFSQEYMTKAFDKDLMSQLLSFSKQGMFLQELEKNDVSDTLSNLTSYKSTFKDKDGRQHTIKFTLPKVDEDGNCLINGNLKRMVLQRVNTPICKVGPNRVSLSSNFNKTIVERNTSFSNNFLIYIRRIFDKAGNQVKLNLGNNIYPTKKLPYEYSALASVYNNISGKKFNWNFIVDDRFNDYKEDEKKDLLSLEKKYGIFLGKTDSKKTFLSIKGVLSIVEDENTVISTTILNLLKDMLDGVVFPPFYEWVNFNVLNKKIPLIFVLAYRFGLSNILKYLNIKYEKHDLNERISTKPSDVVIKFSDVKLVFTNLSTVQRLIVCGLSNLDVEDVNFKDMDTKDPYYELIQSIKLTINYLKGIDDIYDLFIDPITEDVLRQMGEPTNVRDLLIRATVLLSTEDFNEAASSHNFRYRNYERFNAIIYKQLARAFATYRNKAIGHTNKFSISEYDILGAISTDPLMENVDTINPVGDLKSRHRYSHIGDGGRTDESMIIQDRRYPKDGVGIISEGSADSGKVGIDGILSSNPSIVNIRGMCKVKDIKDITAAEMLSPISLLMPGSDLDD